ncbi:glycosyl hydrolase family 17 [Flavobacteriales bacterium 33_180_T64]|nr:glycosyl hydrolase family 17 [Flavobacteriales bacterium 33_180_T64]
MKLNINIIIVVIISMIMLSCNQNPKAKKEMQIPKQVVAKDILGNPNYLAISYGGYREKSRDSQPSILELKEDMKLLSAMGIKVLRTYNVQLPLPHASNVLKAIDELKKEDPNFEMYVMLGAWIDCLNAWTDQPVNHDVESPNNAAEIERAVTLAKQYPDIVKVIAVGNEAMVKWATSYYVQPQVILKWVSHLQDLKQEGELPKDLWITSSDDFASWGGGERQYHTIDLEQLAKTVDYISMHTYPFHNSHYNPEFWGIPEAEEHLTTIEKIDAAMKRAVDFSKRQYDSVGNYMKSIGVNKPIHIGETGWATTSKGFYGANGSRATDEYKQGLFYKLMREWTNKEGISCFYFEAFNEQWKDAHHPNGSENHFGLFTLDGKAKYPIWDFVDKGVFNGLTRNRHPIIKTYNGDKDILLDGVLVPPTLNEIMAN